MSLFNISTIYLKEVKEIVRDRRTLMFMILFPTILMPVILNVTTEFMEKAEKKASSEVIKYAIFGGDQLPALAEAFASDASFEKVELANLDEVKDAIRDNRIGLALGVPSDAAALVAANEQVVVDLYYDNAALVSKVKSRASEKLESISNTRRDERLDSMGVVGMSAREQLLEPISVRQRGVASKREVIGAAAGGFLPYMFIIFCFLGCLYPAIDLGAGEKERGTLETLLLSPVPRHHMVLGKFLVVFSCGVTSSILSIASMAIWLFTKVGQMPPEISAVLDSITALDLTLLASMLIPIAAMFAALLLAISIFARSFKEAQAYATPLNFLVILPAMLVMIPGVELDWTWAMVPITNIALSVKELIKGTMDYTMFVAILGSSTAIAGGLLFACTKWFQREAVLFRA